MNNYTKEELRNIFQCPFNQEAWKAILQNLFHADMIRKKAELFSSPEDNEKGYYMGAMETSDSYRIGLFYYIIENGSVAHKKVGLRNLVKKFVNANWGEFDAAIVVFDDKKEWRLSFVCDIKEEATAPKRFTFVFGEHDNFYRTAVDRFIGLQKVEPTFEKIREAFSVEALSDDFFDEYREQYADFVQYINGKRYVKENNKWVERALGKPNSQYVTTFENDDKLVRDYIKKMFGRIVFLYFLQRKGWLNYNRQYMHDLFYNSDKKDNFLDGVLEPLFFEILNTDKPYRTSDARALPGSENIPYLNGGLFARDEIDERTCVFPAEYFKKLFDFLDSYNFTIDENDTDDAEIGIDPEMLGRIFENLLEDNKDKGAFYTPKEIVDYMCRESIIAYLQNDKFSDAGNDTIRKLVETYDGSTLSIEQRKYIKEKLKAVKICDPAIGSGAFPMGLVNLLSKLYSALRLSTDASVIKRHIMEQNIYGVDIEKGAVDIARLRFWLAMIVEEKDPIPLPNLHFKIMQGNSLLESYQGVDLSDLVKIKSIKASLFDSDDSERESLKSDIKLYYNTSDHTKRDRLFTNIIRNVRRQLFAKQVMIPEGFDPSENSDFFLWQTWFIDVFENGGFDIVIGNPPYIDAKKLKSQSAKLKRFSIYDGTADIYTYFYEQAISLANENGIISFITSNKWMRSDYGANLRKLFLNYRIIALIDFNQNRLFNATVDTNILILTKQNNLHSPVISSIEKNAEKTSLVEMIEKYSVSDVKLGLGYWYLKKDVNKDRIKLLIEKVGKPLKEFDLTINRGVLTGYNDAFIISRDTRDNILSSCLDQVERDNTALLIQPLLRGKDIKKFAYDWHNLYLISTFPSRHYNIEDYPALKNFLLSFGIKKLEQSGREYFIEGKKIKARKKTKNDWFEIQDNIGYWKDFLKPKILWQAISKDMTFALDLRGEFCADVTAFIMVGKDLPYFLAFLNSRLFNYAIMSIYLEGDTFKSKNAIIQDFHIPVVSDEIKNRIIELSNKAIQLEDKSEILKSIDLMVYRLYNLDYEDILVIEPNTPISRNEYESYRFDEN